VKPCNLRFLLFWAPCGGGFAYFRASPAAEKMLTAWAVRVREVHAFERDVPLRRPFRSGVSMRRGAAPVFVRVRVEDAAGGGPWLVRPEMGPSPPSGAVPSRTKGEAACQAGRRWRSLPRRPGRRASTMARRYSSTSLRVSASQLAFSAVLRALRA